MGAANVKGVYGMWGHLPDRPFRLLAFMALTAKDDHKPAMYWGGRDTLAVALGRGVPTGDTKEARAARNATYVAVRAAIAHLIEAGAIARTRHSSPGKTAEYELNLTIPTGQEIPALNGAGQTCATGQGKPAQQGRINLRTGQDKPALEEEQDYRGLTSGEAGSPQPASEQGAATACDKINSRGGWRGRRAADGTLLFAAGEPGADSATVLAVVPS